MAQRSRVMRCLRRMRKYPITSKNAPKPNREPVVSAAVASSAALWPVDWPVGEYERMPGPGRGHRRSVRLTAIWGNVDCKDGVSPVDALKILRFDAGLDVSQEAGCPAMGNEVTLIPQ